MKVRTKRGARRIRNQRVVTRRFVVTDYTGCSYITAGKRYPLTLDKQDYDMIVDDEGDSIYIGSIECPHIGGRYWSHVI